MFPKLLEIRSKEQAPQFKSSIAWAAISIATENNTWPRLVEENRRGLLRMVFSDVSYPHIPLLYPAVPFDRSMAFQVLEFIESMWDRADLFLITSDRGCSRAPAIAAAICRTRWGEGWDQYFLDRYLPINYLVYHMLLKAYFDPYGHML